MKEIASYRSVELHRKDLIVLKDVNFSLEAGEFVYLIGKVGSGKSSLIKSMYAEIPVAAGTAEVLGYDLTSIRNRDIPMLRRQIG
ncbi:MAG: ATP-binding cassette domain-containing protein, partial [Paramuribaculum sp.]|nr:ATP-binding cassette domain-containing protein [Paramuribaculum sp.]